MFWFQHGVKAFHFGQQIALTMNVYHYLTNLLLKVVPEFHNPNFSANETVIKQGNMSFFKTASPDPKTCKFSKTSLTDGIRKQLELINAYFLSIYLLYK